MARKLTPDQMVMPKAIAPFEAAEAFAEWSRRAGREATALGLFGIDAMYDEARLEMCRGLGPPNPVHMETHTEYGERVAVALFTLIMEI